MENKIIIINGPNLNLLGKRKPEIYGNTPFEHYVTELRTAFPNVQLTCLQSNHEGQLIDWLHEYGFGKADGIVLNAGGYTHTSVALHDAVEAIETPVAEVHITDITHREPFRRTSLLTDVCAHTIRGHGLKGYEEAIQWLSEHWEKKQLNNRK